MKTQGMNIIVWIVCFMGVCDILADTLDCNGKRKLIKATEVLCIKRSEL